MILLNRQCYLVTIPIFYQLTIMKLLVVPSDVLYKIFHLSFFYIFEFQPFKFLLMDTERIIEFINQTYSLLSSDIIWIEELLYVSIGISIISFTTTITLNNRVKQLLEIIEQQGKNNTSININQK